MYEGVAVLYDTVKHIYSLKRNVTILPMKKVCTKSFVSSIHVHEDEEAILKTSCHSWKDRHFL